MKKHILPASLKTKFLFFTLILMVILGIGISGLSYSLYSRNLTAYSIQSAETKLKILQSKINSNLENIDSLIKWCQYNSDIENYLTSISENNADNDALTRQASGLLYQKYIGNPASAYISRLIIAPEKGEQFLQETSANFYSEERNMLQTIQELPYFNHLMEGPAFSFDTGIQDDPFTGTDEKLLPVIQPVYGERNLPSGYLYLQVSLFLFSDPLVEFYREDGSRVCLTVNNSTYEVTENSLDLVNTDIQTESLTYDYLSKDTRIYKVLSGSHQGVYVTLPLSTRGCYISQLVSTESVNVFTSGYIVILLFILIFLVIIGGLILILFSRNVTRPINLLKKRITAIAGGDFSRDSSIEWDNELGDIGKNINCLATDIDNLMEQRIQYERQKKDYEYQILQSQINPHFLYNTLNSIKWMASAQHATGIPEMTTALAHLLKSISKGTSSIIALKDEIHLLDLYFIIQKYRYGGTITLEYQIDSEDLLNCAILRFTLQPIVENSIFHGIEPKGQGGRIGVHIFRNSSSRLQIDITDNGVGMSPETVQEVLSGKTSGHSSFFKQIGIGNVNNRIKYNFGEEYGLTIESIPGEFTKVSILLPISEYKGGNSHDQNNHSR